LNQAKIEPNHTYKHAEKIKEFCRYSRKSLGLEEEHGLIRIFLVINGSSCLKI